MASRTSDRPPAACLAPLLIGSLGVQGALVLTGAILPIAAVLLGSMTRDVDEGGPAAARRVELLRGQPLFAPLSLATVEHLAATMTPRHFDAGTWLMREGEPGDDYLLIETGEVEVSQGDARSCGARGRARGSARSR